MHQSTPPSILHLILVAQICHSFPSHPTSPSHHPTFVQAVILNWSPQRGLYFACLRMRWGVNFVWQIRTHLLAELCSSNKFKERSLERNTHTHKTKKKKKTKKPSQSCVTWSLVKLEKLKLKSMSREKTKKTEDWKGINQPRLFYHFIQSCFFSLVLAFITHFWVAAALQAVLFALWTTARELTRLLVFVAHAYNHMWKKDLQLSAFADQRWLFIPSFSRAKGLF